MLSLFAPHKKYKTQKNDIFVIAICEFGHKVSGSRISNWILRHRIPYIFNYFCSLFTACYAFNSKKNIPPSPPCFKFCPDINTLKFFFGTWLSHFSRVLTFHQQKNTICDSSTHIITYHIVSTVSSTFVACVCTLIDSSFWY